MLGRMRPSSAMFGPASTSCKPIDVGPDLAERGRTGVRFGQKWTALAAGALSFAVMRLLLSSLARLGHLGPASRLARHVALPCAWIYRTVFCMRWAPRCLQGGLVSGGMAWGRRATRPCILRSRAGPGAPAVCRYRVARSSAEGTGRVIINAMALRSVGIARVPDRYV